MSRIYPLLVLMLFTGFASGCQCYRVTHRYAGVIDTVSDYKMELDPLYVPGLDISRVGMPDWQRFGLNRLLCPCANGNCCRNCKPVYYPAEYRLKYWAAQAEVWENAGDETLDIVPEEAPELAPPPLPESH